LRRRRRRRRRAILVGVEIENNLSLRAVVEHTPTQARRCTRLFCLNTALANRSGRICPVHASMIKTTTALRLTSTISNDAKLYS
jgi:hypothetical protein